ncbi:MAG TPA: DUF308 domain-containing protein [Candidatus Methylacidiphilales bacterium]|jgi:uncharacterized membrane protein HdeD (DUF308 family)|nr:DUF308 domain-containing protein [Candidatus Methylacidiphilales bacterium]
MADGDTPVPHKPGWFLFLGIIYIFAGAVAIITPEIVTLLSVVFFGVILMIAGIATLIHAFWTHRWDGFAVQLLAGILASVAGFLLVSDAAAGAVAITIILASYFLVSGFFRLGYGVMRASRHHRAALIVSGLVSLLLGVLIAVHWPGSSMWVIGTFVGVDLIFYGFSLITLARALK